MFRALWGGVLTELRWHLCKRVENSYYNSVTASGVRLNQVWRWRKFYYKLDKLDNENISSASKMNKAVVVFLKEEILVNRLVSSGVSVSGLFVGVSPLVNSTRKVIISNVPPFIPDDEIEHALLYYGKFF